jgi:UDP-2-acetamido-3-amino-2,3-dideoxy-glucuronate N-acetyltransferase
MTIQHIVAAVIHPSAIVDAGARIGDGTRVWHFVQVAPGAVIGARCTIGHGCYVGNVVVGDGCRIQNQVSLFDGVTLEDDVFVGPHAAFTNVAHPRAHVSRHGEFAPTRVCRGATIGANATIRCGVTIGAYALVGAGAVVTRDVAAHAIVTGVPARRTGWACACGETLPASLACARCGASYPGLQAPRRSSAASIVASSLQKQKRARPRGGSRT